MKKKTHAEYAQQLLDKGITFTPRADYINGYTAILHSCPKGHTWSARPDNILSGKGCPHCAPNKRRTHEEYEESLMSLEASAYPLEPYVNNYTSIKHGCIEGHEWYSTPNHILSGRGCPSCANYGFDNTKPASLYYIKLSDGISIYYKIGITNSSVSERFFKSKDKSLIQKVFFEQRYDAGQDARDVEQSILKKYAEHRSYCDFISSGKTEVFEIDVLGLDTQK